MVGDKRDGSNSKAIARYLTVLQQEISKAAKSAQPLETLFFGGGTPSLLTAEQLEQLMQFCENTFGFAQLPECSIEMDPGTFDLEKILGYKAAGINRVSLGVQAFQPESLENCGRTHSVEDIYAAVDLIHQAQIENFSVDLIAGLPHQTLDNWAENVEQAIALHPPHISVYDLIVEPKTPFSRTYQPGVAPLPSEATTAEMYRLTHQLLTKAGYAHYEISNYAKPGYQCRHNRMYWENRPYYGFGMGAASYLQGDRFTRPRTTQTYAEWVAALQPQAVLSMAAPNQLELLLDTLMLGLRLAEGISLNDLTQRFGASLAEQVLDCLVVHQQKGLVEIVDGVVVAAGKPETTVPIPVTQPGGDRYLRLTAPEGMLFSNTVLTTLFETFDEQ